MGIENEDDRQGEIFFNTASKIPRGVFYMGLLNGVKFDRIYMGSITDLGESFFVNGEAKRLTDEGIDVYFFYNPEDLLDEEISQRILPKGMTYRKGL